MAAWVEEWSGWLWVRDVLLDYSSGVRHVQCFEVDWIDADTRPMCCPFLRHFVILYAPSE